MNTHRIAQRYVGFVAIAAVVAAVAWLAPSPAGSTATGLGNFAPTQSTVPRGPVDCTRQSTFGTMLGCEPIWHGASNGGATAKGVAGNSITIAAYGSPDANFISTLLGGEGPGHLIGTPEQEQHTLSVYEQFFNKNFQTYGRHVTLTTYASSGASTNVSSVSRSDAVAIDEQLHAFMTIGGIDEDFFDELAQRGIVNIAGAQLPQSFFKAHEPYVFGMLPTTDTMNSFIADFIGKQLGPHSTARYGGDSSEPKVNGQPRRYGIVYPTTNPDGTPSVYSGVATDLVTKLAAHGVHVSGDDIVGYALDPNSAITQVQADGTRMQNDGVTTIVCLCDPISPIFTSKAAAKAGYFPEWIESGYLLQDYYQLPRLYDQTEWAHTFGVSSLPMSVAPDKELYWLAYKSIDPTTDPTPDAALIFNELLMAFGGIEGAGPDLTPRTFANAMFHIHITSNGPSMPTFYYSPSDYGGVKDAQVVWWSPSALGPDGKAGNYQSVDGGYRHQSSDWPSGDPHVFDPACLPAGSCGGATYAAGTSAFAPGSVGGSGSPASTSSTSAVPGSIPPSP